MEQPKLTDKRLVRYLMNKKNIEGIDWSRFVPRAGEELLRKG